MYEAWKARDEVAPLLAKDFVWMYVCLSRSQDGQELMNRYPNSKGQGIPWFVVLDSDARALADSNGPKGNIGCPNTDEEIEVFLGILKKVRVALTDDDLTALQKSLVAHREKK